MGVSSVEPGELKYWLWWNRVPGIGPARFYKLLEEFGSMKNAWFASLLELKQFLGEKLILSLQETKKNWDPELELKRIGQNGFRI